MATPEFRRVRGIALTIAIIVSVCLPATTHARTIDTDAVILRIVTCSPGISEVSSGNSDQASETDSFPVGRAIYAELSQTIDVRKVKPGDPIFAKVTLGVLSHGKVLIAEGATITGHVTEATKRTGTNPKSVLGIVFDRAETIDGKEIPINLTVQAIGPGELRARSNLKLEVDSQYSAVNGPISTGGTQQPQAAEDDKEVPLAEREPALDAGSKGMVGLKGLDLTEATDATQGSLITSTSKNVKLGNRWQVVLRVIAPAAIASAKR